MIWETVIGTALKVIDKIIPDPAERDRAKYQLLQMEQAGELEYLKADVELAKGQQAINLAEAGTDLFRGGWRPFVGWVCGSGLAYQFLLRPLLTGFLGHELPSLDLGDLLTILCGMLGLGTLRSFDKSRGLR